MWHSFQIDSPQEARLKPKQVVEAMGRHPGPLCSESSLALPGVAPRALQDPVTPENSPRISLDNSPENSLYTVSTVLSGSKMLCSKISIKVFFNSYYHPKCYLMLETLFDSEFYFVTWHLHCKTDWSWTLKGMEQITK